MERDSFIFYKSFYDAISYLDDKDKLAVLEAILKYQFTGEESQLVGIQNAIWVLIKPQLDANNTRFINGLKGAEFGKLGGRPHKEKELKNPSRVIDENPCGDNSKNPSRVIDENPNKTPNVNVNVNENVNVNVNEKGGMGGKDASDDALAQEVKKPKKDVFEKPTLNELCDEYYVRTGEKHSDAECVKFAEKFLAHYESVGWKVGKNPMKDWRACVRTWIHNEENFG